jgi:hypothetical protein
MRVCPACNTEYAQPKIVQSQPKTVTIAGVFGGAVFLLGVVLCLLSILVGAVVIIAGIAIGWLSHRPKLLMVCPACGVTDTTK